MEITPSRARVTLALLEGHATLTTTTVVPLRVFMVLRITRYCVTTTTTTTTTKPAK